MLIARKYRSSGRSKGDRGETKSALNACFIAEHAFCYSGFIAKNAASSQLMGRAKLSIMLRQAHVVHSGSTASTVRGDRAQQLEHARGSTEDLASAEFCKSSQPEHESWSSSVCRSLVHNLSPQLTSRDTAREAQ
ncbi:hypothetical protein J6590_027537 [Homalodisca vitripennis]|nr:hypothetical protein J6590_027537 [Homalodisca vitripennis]